MRKTAAILLLCLATVAAGATGVADTPKSPAQVGQAWAKAWNEKSMLLLLQLYAPDPVFLPASGERWTGKDVIAAHFWQGLSAFDPHLTLHSKRSITSGDLAFDSGTFDETATAKDGSHPTKLSGNYLFIFQRQPDGRWKILEQSFTEFDPSKM